MKRVWTIALSAVLAGAMACTAWAADVPSHVGIVTGELPEAFQGKEALLEENCKKAYEWALQLHAKEAEDGGFGSARAPMNCSIIPKALRII